MKKFILTSSLFVVFMLLSAASCFAIDFVDDCDDFSKIYDHTPINDVNSWQEGLKTSNDKVLNGGTAIMSTSIGGRPYMTYKMDEDIVGFYIESLYFYKNSSYADDFKLEMSADGLVWLELSEEVKTTEKKDLGGGWRDYDFYCENVPEGMRYLKITFGDSTATGVRYGALIDRVTISLIDDIYRTIQTIKLENYTDEAADSITKNLSLPTSGIGEVTLRWESSNEEVLSSAGVLNAEAFVGYATPVTLTCYVEYLGELQKTITFDLTVRRDTSAFTDEDFIEYDLSQLKFSDFCEQPQDKLVLPFVLPDSLFESSTFSWEVTDKSGADITNYILTPIRNKKEDLSFSLIVTAVKGEAQKTKSFPVTVLKKYSENILNSASVTASSPGISKAMTDDLLNFWETESKDSKRMISAEFQESTDLNCGLICERGENITKFTVLVSSDGKTWEEAYSGTTGGDGERVFFSFPPVECRYVEIVFESQAESIALYNFELYNDLVTDEQIVTQGLSALEVPKTVKEDLNLQSEGPYGGKIIWSSDNEAVLSSDGKVNPIKNKSVSVTLTATLTYGDYSASRSFPVTVAGKISAGFSSGGGGGGNSAALLPSVPKSEEDNTYENDEVFSDVSPSHWAYDYIKALADRGVVSKGEFFRPDDFVTREEFTKMLILVSGEALSEENCNFSDTNSDAWYYSYVANASKMGIAKGKGDGTFGIGESILRQDAAVMAERLIKPETAEKSLEFKDADEISDYAKDAVKNLSQKGILLGDENGFFNPKGMITRAECAKIVYLISLS